ncbi:DUF5658 family protein [Sutcliffiella sp. NPDC057660]|uniref:DUF5658 family protein n=1 Tax=Sutcliffiella sp. NPDC057660 TaxID=3346199 RepID=UPI0036A9A860
MKRLLILLLVLNLFDAVATFIGLNLNMIEEVNPMMAGLYQKDPLLFLGVKAFFSIFLIILLYYVKDIRSLLVKYISVAAVLGYGTVAGIHLYWILHYIA